MRLNIKFLTTILEEFQDKTSLDNQDIIRIEKKINLESKLNNSQNKDENEQILNSLKTNYGELRLIKKYSSLLDYLTDNKIIDKNIYNFIPSDLEKITDCIDLYFKDNIREYFQVNFKQNNFKLLSIFSKYVHILPSQLIEFIQEVLLASLDNAVSLLKSKTKITKTSKPILGILNKDFYLILNQFNCYEIEEKIRKIVNHTANKYNDDSFKQNHKVYLYIMVALKNYEVYDEDLADTINSNYEFAEEKTRTILDKAKGLLKNKFVWFICAVWIFGFFIDNGNTMKKGDYYTNETYIPYMTESKAIHSNQNLFFYFKEFGEKYSGNGINLSLKERLEKDMTKKMEEKYSLESFIKLAYSEKHTKLFVKNVTQKNLYILIDRKLEFRNSLFILKPHTDDTVYMLKDEKFKLITNTEDTSSDFKFQNLESKDARLMEKTFQIKDSKIGESYLTLTQFKIMYFPSHSKNIIQLEK